MTHLLDDSELSLTHFCGEVKLHQFFTKDKKYVLSDTIIIQKKESRDETITTVQDVLPLPFKNQYKLITLKEK